MVLLLYFVERDRKNKQNKTKQQFAAVRKAIKNARFAGGIRIRGMD